MIREFVGIPGGSLLTSQTGVCGSFRREFVGFLNESVAANRAQTFAAGRTNHSSKTKETLAHAA